MKNKINLRKNIEKTNFDFLKNVKWFWLATGIILLAGIIVFACCGFNTGIDYTGGSVVTVKLGEDANKHYTKYVHKIKDALHENELEISSTQKVGIGTETSIVVKYQLPKLSSEKLDELNTNVRLSLQNALPAAIVSESENIGPTVSSNTLLKLALAMLTALVAVFVYLLIRFSYRQAIQTLFMILHDMLLLLSVIAITRIQIGASFIAVVCFMMLCTVIFSTLLFDALREKQKADSTQNLNSLTIQTIKDSIMKVVNFAIVLVLVLLLLFIFGVVNFKLFMLPVLFAAAISIISAIYINLPTFTKLFQDRFFKMKK